MPRQRRSAPAPRQQTRSAHTAAAAPPQQHSYPSAHPQAGAQQRSPGLFGQMASTAAGVAVGSTIGHTLGAGITGMLGGSSNSAPVDQYQQQPLDQYQQQQSTLQNEQSRLCDADARNFTKCLSDNSGNMQICDYYLQQLKACQEASRNY